MQHINIFWFRRDLRLFDNAGLYQALRSGLPVVPLFIFDRNILDKLDDKSDRRVAFIHQAIDTMQQELNRKESSLECFYGKPEQAFEQLLSRYKVEKVFINEDYEPYARERDASIEELLNSKGISLLRFKDQVIFAKDEILKNDGTPYTVFTPYSRKWKTALAETGVVGFPSEKMVGQFYKQAPRDIPRLSLMGFTATGKPFPPKTVNDELILKYGEQRDFPARAGTSRLSVHLRFGTVSIRQLVDRCAGLSETYLNELIWRDFYQMILWHFPQVGQGKAFKIAYDQIEWRKDKGEFQQWCAGQTGYPIVDAGMRELNATGFMHNRVRMVTASFLSKHLLLDWRLGEAYFAEKLLDFDLAANNGGWQWAAGSGCDAAPYFRIFNPYLQTKRFDPKLEYIRKWVPELDKPEYPEPIVQHELARKRCLETYTKALKK